MLLLAGPEQPEVLALLGYHIESRLQARDKP